MGEYGSAMDFMLCCLLSALLFIPARLKRLFASLAALLIFFALASLGWNNIANAVTESLSAINQTVGGVVFGIAVLAGVVAVEWSKGKKSITVQKVLEIVGVGVLVAVALWTVIFVFEAFVTVPNEIRATARKNLAALPEPQRLIPPLLAYVKSTRQDFHSGARAAPIIRFGKDCPEEYKLVPSVKIAEWAMEEADKIGEMSSLYLEKYKDDSHKMMLSIFTKDFKKCCWQPMLDLRTETICRLPPTLKTNEGEEEVSSLSRGPTLSPTMIAIDPLSVQAFAPYLRKLGVQLMRLYVPRRAPMAAIVSATAQQPGVIEVTIKSNTGTISTGYIVVDVDGLDGPYVSGIRAFGDTFRSFGDSFRERDVMGTIANEDVVKYLRNHPSAFAVRISRGHPLSRESPIQMIVSGGPKLQVRSATIFDE